LNVLDTITSFIDKIFQPPIAFLDLAIEQLQRVQMTTAQGLNLSQYFAVFGDLPFHFQLVVSSILISTVMLGSLILFRSVLRLYFAIKEGVQWW